MITLTDIKKSINRLLKSNFDIDVIAQDVEKGFQRPSFTVYFDNVKIETLDTQIETSLTVRIYYFTEIEANNASIELLEMQQQLPLVFGNNLKVQDRAIHISDIDLSIVDGILIFEFGLSFEQAQKEDMDIPLMDNLRMNI